MINTLVIHPRDPTTEFLRPTYADMDATVVRSSPGTHDLMELAERHDRIMMMGHGSGMGLFNVTPNGTLGHYLINGQFADVLKERDNSIMIWCNADRYVRYHGLRGFYTGMFISELGEAHVCGIDDPKVWDVEESNDTFAELVGKFGEYSTPVIHAGVKREYGEIRHRNKVADYNHQRLYLN